MKTLLDIEKFAKDEWVPIARHQTVEFMKNLIKDNNYTSFFEIGTAIGYTSIILKKTFPYLDITTIEHDLDRAQMAKENFIDFGIDGTINFIIDDAIEYQTNKKFDLIFIDAAKKRNRYFLEKFLPNLKTNGSIIIDNMKLEDFWIDCNLNKKAEYDEVNEEFKEYVKHNPNYDYTFYDDIGDGIVVIKLKYGEKIL